MNPRLFLFSTFLIFFAVFTQLLAQVGHRCTFRHTNVPGICKVAADCPKVKEQAQNGISPVICGFKDTSIPIVCCEETGGNPVPNENSFLNIESNVPDALSYPEENNNRPNNNLRISEQKCDEYSRLTTQSVNALALISNAAPVTINITNCDFNGIPLIYGGQPAVIGEFPFMAAIGFKDQQKIMWLCGGTLISNNYVITAGHCTSTINYGPPAVVKLGEVNLISDSSTGIEINIAKIEVHPNYSRARKYNDIALLKLEREVDFSNNIRPACLWRMNQINHATGIAIGWGKTEKGVRSNILQKVQLDILDNSVCNRTFEVNKKLPNGIVETMLCAGVGMKDTCQGDSGGPLLVAKDKNLCVHYVVGITSFGTVCGTEGIPAVYTRMSEYLSWVERTVWP